MAGLRAGVGAAVSLPRGRAVELDLLPEPRGIAGVDRMGVDDGHRPRHPGRDVAARDGGAARASSRLQVLARRCAGHDAHAGQAGAAEAPPEYLADDPAAVRCGGRLRRAALWAVWHRWRVPRSGEYARGDRGAARARDSLLARGGA